MFAAGAFLGRGRSARGRISVPLLIALVSTAVMIGLRYDVGGDWGNYLKTYRHVAYLDFVQTLRMANSDPAYSLVNWVGQALGVRIWFVNMVCGAIFVWGLTKLALQQPSPWTFFLALTPYCLIVVGMGYTRQSAAIGLVAAALASFRSVGMRTAAAYLALAVLFHKSSIVMLPLLALAERRSRLVNVMLGAVLAAILYYFLVAGKSDRMFENYVGSAMESRGAAIRVLMTILPTAAFLLFSKRFGFDERELPLMRILAYAGLAAGAGLILMPASTAVDRLALYLMPFQAVILSRLSWAFTKKTSDFAITTALVVYSAAVLFVWLNYADNAYAWIPYRVYPLAS